MHRLRVSLLSLILTCILQRGPKGYEGIVFSQGHFPPDPAAACRLPVDSACPARPSLLPAQPAHPACPHQELGLGVPYENNTFERNWECALHNVMKLYVR